MGQIFKINMKQMARLFDLVGIKHELREIVTYILDIFCDIYVYLRRVMFHSY